MQTPSEVLFQYTQLIERWQQSGKNIRQFCNDENIGYHAFHYWKKKIQKKSENGFIKLKHAAPVVAASIWCELVFASGNRVLFHQLPHVNFVKQLLR